MKKHLIINLILITICSTVLSAYAVNKNDSVSDIKISNRLFSINLPYETKDTYIIKKRKKGIFVYDKASKKAGFGGFAFGIMPYKNPSEHSMMPGGRKIGELSDKRGTLYDMVLIQPTDVQYDYVNDKKESYMRLYNLAENVGINNGKNSQYHKNQGMKGETLYNDILRKHLTAINEKWDSNKLEKENMSYMYNVIAQSNKNVLDKVGYVYYDLNGDGIDELLIGEITQGETKGVIYDIYTMVDRKPEHVISGGSRNRYFACDKVFICNEASLGANESNWLVYILVENSTELFGQVGFKYDGYTNPKVPWFLTYDFPVKNWDNVSEKVFKERKKVFDSYERFDFIPLSSFKNATTSGGEMSLNKKRTTLQ